MKLFNLFSIISFVLMAIPVSLLNAQQRVDHHLVVELDDVRHVITGTDSLLYHNHSSDTLRHLYFHLWPNALQPGTELEAWFTNHGDGRLYYADRGEQGAVTGLFFRAGGHRLQWELHEGRGDICRVDLREPLLPGQTLNLHTMFRLQIPRLVAGDLSHSDHAYFLANWFPRPAVYTSQQWTLVPNHYQGRLPGEFGDFTVQITLPRNYIVASSGALIDDLDEERFLQGITDRTGRINRWGNRESARFPASASRNKTITLHQRNTSDFVLCLDKRFHLITDTVVVSSGVNEQVININLFFTVFEAQYWSEAMPSVKRAVRLLSEQVGPYPFETLSLVQTSWLTDSRAFPGVIRIGSVMAPLMMESAVAHGIADHWFNVQMVTNHYREPWLSRGLPGFFTMKFLNEAYPDTVSMQDILFDPSMRMQVAGLDDVPANRFFYYRLAFAQDHLEGSVLSPVNSLSPDGYTALATLRSAFALNTVASWMGEEAFMQMLERYYAAFHGGHASGRDLKGMIRQEAGEEVYRWFVEELLRSSSTPDYKLTRVRRSPEGYRLTVRNVSGVKSPYPITATTQHGETTRWHPGHAGKSTIEVRDTTHAIRRFVIDSRFSTPEVNRQNNTIRTRGLFRTVEPLSLVPLVAIPNPSKTQITPAPVIGWNTNNGLMAGVALYSNPLIPPPTEFLVMPMYGFGNDQPAGTIRITHRHRLNSPALKNVVLGAEAKQYGYKSRNLPLSFRRLMMWGDLEFQGRSPHATSMVKARTAWVEKDNEVFITADSMYSKGGGEQYLLSELSFRYRVHRLLNPFTLQASVQHAGDMLRLHTENRFVISYPSPGKALSVRLFAGVMLMKPETITHNHLRFTTAGIGMNTPSGFSQHDPWFDHIYPGRNHHKGLFRYHMYVVDGGFRRGTTVGNNSHYMVTVNLASSVPGPLPLKLYLDAGIFADETKGESIEPLFLFSTGVMVSLIPNVLEINFPFPFAESDAIGEREALNFPDLKYHQKIRFVLHLERFNPLTLPRRVRFQ